MQERAENKKTGKGIGIWAAMNKVPGGLLIIPLVITAVINTIFPSALAIGSLTTAMFTSTGTLTIAGLLIFIAGTQLKVEQLGAVIKRGGVLIIVKLLICIVTCTLFIKWFGLDGVLGISAVAFCAAMCSTNPGVYMALVSKYGDETDLVNFAVLNILSMQVIPIAIIASATGTSFNAMEIVAILVPFILGIVLGNLDPVIRKVMGAGTPILLPFLGFCFGSTVNLISAFKNGLAGIALSVIVLVINVVILVAADKLILRRPGYAFAASCAIAGIACSVPQMLAASNEELYGQYVSSSVATIALAMLITSLVVPFITKWTVKKWGCARPAEEAEKTK